MATTGSPPPPAATRPRWALAVVVVAVLAVVVALVVGLRGLFGNPVRGTDATGVTTIAGTWEPYSCDAHACEGYVQQGGRSVFVQLPGSCPSRPQRSQDVTLRARRAPPLGTGAYRAVDCSLSAG